MYVCVRVCAFVRVCVSLHRMNEAVILNSFSVLLTFMHG